MDFKKADESFVHTSIGGNNSAIDYIADEQRFNLANNTYE